MGQHILVPVDGSEQSEKAYEYVLNELPEPTITLLHVVKPVSSVGFGDDEYFDFESYQEETNHQRDRGEQMLDEYRQRGEEQGIDVTTVLRSGNPAKQILAWIENNDVDHIVMGSRGRSGVGRVLFGSVAETVTRRATVPVTIIR